MIHHKNMQPVVPKCFTSVIIYARTPHKKHVADSLTNESTEVAPSLFCSHWCPLWSRLSARVCYYSAAFLSACRGVLTAIKKSRLQLGIKVSTMAVRRGSSASTIVQTAANVVSQSTGQGGWCFVILIQTRLWCE